MDAMRKFTRPPPDVPTPKPILKQRNVIAAAEEACDIYQMAAKLKKCQHQKRELIYQKNYLLKLLSGFHLTEAATLAFIAHMKEGVVEQELEDESSRLKPISKFRAAVNAVIAIHRMRFLVKRWALPPVAASSLKKKVFVSTPQETAPKRTFISKPNNSNSVQATASFARNKSKSPEGSLWTRHADKAKDERCCGTKGKAADRSRAATDAIVDDFRERIRRVHDDMNYSHSLSEADSFF